MPGKLKEKAEQQGFVDPRAKYQPAHKKTKTWGQDLDSLGPKEQTIKLDPTVKGRGKGKKGVTIGGVKRKKLRRSNSSMSTGGSRRTRNY